jgi:[ribosomal protein S5]-alanine N-acetyltransferase
MVTPPSFPIVTPRLWLRPLVADDAAALFAMDSDPKVHTFLGNAPVKDIAQIHEAIAMIQAQYAAFGTGRWAVVLQETGECIGWAGLKYVHAPAHGRSKYYDLGYRLHRDHWGRGYATEAAEAILQVGFGQMGLTQIHALVDVANLGSRRVLAKLGFVELESMEDDGVPHLFLGLDAAHWQNRSAT